MARSQQYKISTAILQVIKELEVEGPMTSRRVAFEVMQRHPELCDEFKDRLFRESIGSIARKIMKREVEATLDVQDLLPLGPADVVRVPEHISLPPRGDDPDMEWQRIEMSSLRQLKANAAYKRKVLDSGNASLADQLRLIRLLEPIVPEEDIDAPLAKYLRRLDRGAA